VCRASVAFCVLMGGIALVGARAGTAQEQVIVPHTTGEIVVLVRDSRTGRAIELATVSCSFVGLTKADGSVVLRNVPVSATGVTTTALGYYATLSSVVVGADAAETLRVALQREPRAVVIGDTARTPRGRGPRVTDGGKADLVVQVLDRRDSTAVGYANVVVDGRDAGLTDESGKARVHGLESGLHSVVIRAIGYEVQAPDSFMLRADEVRTYRHMLVGGHVVKY
jgi:hypothetical protein